MCWSDGFCRLEIPCGHTGQHCCDADVDDVSASSPAPDFALVALGEAEAALGVQAELDGLQEVVLNDAAWRASTARQSDFLAGGGGRRT